MGWLSDFFNFFRRGRRVPVPPAPVSPPVSPPPWSPPPPLPPDSDPRLLVIVGFNRARIAAGLPPLRADLRLMMAAQKGADIQAGLGLMEHVRDWAQRFTDAGYSWSAAAEDVAEGQPDADAVVAAWLASPAHRANIMGRFADVGVGLATAKTGLMFWCADFARRPCRNLLENRFKNLQVAIL